MDVDRPIEGEGRMVRFYLAWNHAASAEFAHVPKDPRPARAILTATFRSLLRIRGFARRFVKSAAIGLIDLRREACARGLELRDPWRPSHADNPRRSRDTVHDRTASDRHGIYATRARRCRDAIGAADALDKD